jgi:hypothetical protein
VFDKIGKSFCIFSVKKFNQEECNENSLGEEWFERQIERIMCKVKDLEKEGVLKKEIMCAYL